MDELAARLAETAERDGLSRRTDAGLLFELAPRCRKPVLARLDEPFRNGPRAVVLGSPERAAGMDEKDQNAVACALVEQQPGTLLAHRLTPRLCPAGVPG